MTNENTMVSTKDLQELQSISMALLSMSDGYSLSASIRTLIEDLNDKTEKLNSSPLESAA
jgi:hypothetical protein